MRKEDVYIVGGGGSLKGFDFKSLKDKDTIAVNGSALDVPNPTYCITADSGQFIKIQDGCYKDVDTTWVLVTNPNHCSMKWKDGKFVHRSGRVLDLFSVHMVIRNAGVVGIGFEFNDFRTGYNSGFCGFQLAVLLGYKRIHLLGFDLIQCFAHEQHYHNRYKNQKTTSDVDMEKFYINFRIALKRIREETDIRVVSHSANSRLNGLIPYAPLGEIK